MLVYALPPHRYRARGESEIFASHNEQRPDACAGPLSRLRCAQRVKHSLRYARVKVTSILPRVALEYGQT